MLRDTKQLAENNRPSQRIRVTRDLLQEDQVLEGSSTVGLPLSIIPLFVAAAMRPSMPEVQKRDDVVEQAHEEGHEERDTAEPGEHELAVAGAGRRRGNPDNVVNSSEQFCEEFDHSRLQ